MSCILIRFPGCLGCTDAPAKVLIPIARPFALRGVRCLQYTAHRKSCIFLILRGSFGYTGARQPEPGPEGGGGFAENFCAQNKQLDMQ